jgi:hypothetical protein
MTTERVHFRLIQTPCCGTMLCWVNPRFPTYCPECGKQIYLEVKACVMAEDDMATLRTDNNMTTRYLENRKDRLPAGRFEPQAPTHTQTFVCPPPTRFGQDEYVCPGCALRWDTNEARPQCLRKES